MVLRMRYDWLFFLIVVQLSCSPETVLPEPQEQQQRTIRSLSVEKSGISDSEYKILFDEEGKPISFNSLNGSYLIRSFGYGPGERLTTITDHLPQVEIQEFFYEDDLLSYQTIQSGQSEITLEYIYNQEEVQVMRFIDLHYHSSIFFKFSDAELRFLKEIKSYDGVGRLRHHYVMEYDSAGNVVSQKNFSYNFLLQELILQKRIEQQYDNQRNPLSEGNQPGWITAWHMAHLDSESMIENISRFSPNNVITRSVTVDGGQTSITTFDYDYDGYGYPIHCTRLTDGEYDVRTYLYEYYYN